MEYIIRVSIECKFFILNLQLKVIFKEDIFILL